MKNETFERDVRLMCGIDKMTAKQPPEISKSRIHVDIDEICVLAIASQIVQYAADLPTRSLPIAIRVYPEFYAWFALDASGTVVWGARKTKGWASRDALAFLRGERPQLFV